MKQKPVSLSKADTAILNSYKILAEGLAEYLGEGCEIVIHSLGNLEHSVIKIINGQHTGRKEGSPITDLGLSMVKSLSENDSQKHMAYFNKTMDGIPLKSCSIAITGEKGYIIGLLCMSRAIWIRRVVRGLISFRLAMVSRIILDKSETSTSGT